LSGFQLRWGSPNQCPPAASQLRSHQGDLTLFGRWPDEPALLKPLAEQARALAIPPDNLDQITAPTTEDEQMARFSSSVQSRFVLRAIQSPIVSAIRKRTLSITPSQRQSRQPGRLPCFCK
jgi:hypothetical protein